jgi:hypothetical protein
MAASQLYPINYCVLVFSAFGREIQDHLALLEAQNHYRETPK